MGKVLVLLLMLLVAVAVVAALVVVLNKLLNRQRDVELKSLREENASLRRDESPKLKELRTELDEKDDLLDDHNRLLDRVIAEAATPVNPMDLGTRREQIIDLVSSRRPRSRRELQ